MKTLSDDFDHNGFKLILVVARLFRPEDNSYMFNSYISSLRKGASHFVGEP